MDVLAFGFHPNQKGLHRLWGTDLYTLYARIRVLRAFMFWLEGLMIKRNSVINLTRGGNELTKIDQAEYDINDDDVDKNL